MTNPTDLNELRKLLEKATPGTLRAEAGETAKLRDDFGLVAIMSHLTRYPLPVAGAATPSRRRDSDKVAALAHLVAAALNALPALLDELQAFRDGARPCHDCPDLQTAIDDLETELESARAKLEAVEKRARDVLDPGSAVCPNDVAYVAWGDDWEAALKGGSNK